MHVSYHVVLKSHWCVILILAPAFNQNLIILERPMFNVQVTLFLPLFIHMHQCHVRLKNNLFVSMARFFNDVRGERVSGIP